jgi:hypothetical protein
MPGPGRARQRRGVAGTASTPQDRPSVGKRRTDFLGARGTVFPAAQGATRDNRLVSDQCDGDCPPDCTKCRIRPDGLRDLGPGSGLGGACQNGGDRPKAGWLPGFWGEWAWTANPPGCFICPHGFVQSPQPSSWIGRMGPGLGHGTGAPRVADLGYAWRPENESTGR